MKGDQIIAFFKNDSSESFGSNSASIPASLSLSFLPNLWGEEPKSLQIYWDILRNEVKDRL